MRLNPLLSALAVAFGAALPASAHAGFLVPVADDTEASGEIILAASFSDSFPVEEIALVTDTWTIITPEGDTMAFDRIAETSTRSVLQATLAAEGTYRVSTGERLGRKGEAARIDGEIVRLGADGVSKEALPEGAEVLTAQTATVSDIYVTRGAASDAVLGTEIGRLAIVPGANPTGLVAGDTFEVTVEFDGAPLAGAPVSVFTPGNSGDEDEADTRRVTGEDGTLTLDLTDPGPHLLMIRHLADAPEGAETDVRSYTTVLTVMVG